MRGRPRASPGCLPLVDGGGKLRGIVSLGGIVLACREAGKTPDPRARHVVDVLAADCQTCVQKKEAGVPPARAASGRFAAAPAAATFLHS